MTEADLVSYIIATACEVSNRRMALEAGTEFKLAGLDSLGLINLTARIEDALGIEFEPEDLTQTSLATPNALALLLRDKYGAAV
jgi:acyl carrier protein